MVDDQTRLLRLCDRVNDLLTQAGLDHDDKLSCLASVMVGLINSLEHPKQRQIHIDTLCAEMRKHVIASAMN